MARDGATSAFAGEPQPVEVFHRGRWYAGELLGWRHDEDGRCWVRVRVVVDRLRHSAWVDLTDLRLPAPAAPAPARPRIAPPARTEEDSDTQPHVLLPRSGGRPPVPRRAAVPPAVAPAPAAVLPPAVPTAATGAFADEVATTRGFPLPVG